MHTLTEELCSYAAYHRDLRNKLTHFVGVPTVVYSVFLFLAWFRLTAWPELPLSAATLFFIGVFAYYIRLDRVLALIQLPISAALYYAADRTAVLPFSRSVGIFFAAFVGGWTFQLIGHWFEGRKPALLTNLMQIFNAPLFLTVELLFLIGWRPELKAQVERA